MLKNGCLSGNHVIPGGISKLAPDRLFSLNPFIRVFAQVAGANSNAKKNFREVPIDGSRRAGKWVGVTRAGGALVEASSADGKGVTP